MKHLLLVGTLTLACLSLPGQQDATPLFNAIRANDLAAVSQLLIGSNNLETRDSRGNTPLIFAASFGSPETLRLLLDKGAEVNSANDFGATALIRAASDPVKARMLIEKGANVNAAGKMGRTPLMVAASCDGCSATVRLLIEKGADVNAHTPEGGDALTSAANARDFETVRLLLEKGADAKAVDKSGSNALMSAATNCDLNAIRLLLSKGADVNAANTSGNEVKFGKIQLINLTPLMLAVPFCPAPVIRTLLDAGAKINAKDIRAMTPLMLAVSSEHQDQAVIRQLLAARADVNEKSTVGETALDWAKKFNNRETLARLTKAGAKEGVAFTPPVNKTTTRTASEAAVAAVRVVQSSSSEFMRQSGCGPACHHPVMATILQATASKHGKGDTTALKENVNAVRGMFTALQEGFLQLTGTGGATDSTSYAMLALEAAGDKPTPVTDALVLYTLRTQRLDGAWTLGGISRAPLEESNIGRTAMAVRNLNAYCPPGLKAECTARIARAQTWLLRAVPSTNDDFATRLSGLHATGATADKISTAAKALVSRQRPDGGWAQNDNLASDAFATGESLWLLQATGTLKPADPVYQRGVKYLLGTQSEDGSWFVRSRAPKFQPYFQSGFPYDHDQWISTAATVYAGMALLAAN